MTLTQMSTRNAQRIAERLELDRPKVTEAQVEEYRQVHYPERADHVDHADRVTRVNRPPPIPGNAYIAKLSHERFHEWFGTECDGTCPHPRPVSRDGGHVVCQDGATGSHSPTPRAPWWRRLFGLAVVAIVLTACTTTTPAQPATWQDAWTVYLQAWCANTERCAWDYYSAHFPDGACVETELEHFCVETATYCTAPYPQSHDAALDQCVLEVENLYCGALLPPDSCFEAFTP